MTDIRFALKTCNTIMTLRLSGLLLKGPRSRGKSSRRSVILTAEGIRAMPSARALLVASLLTEPPYGCLGPPGNDRYRKRSLRSQAVGASRKSSPAPRVYRLGSWALKTSKRGGRGGQDKANWRSRTRRPSAVKKPLSAHWFLEVQRMAVNDNPSRPDGAIRA